MTATNQSANSGVPAGFFAVTPKRDCPHCTPEHILPKEEFVGVHVNDPCPDCGNVGENWVCFKPGCRIVKCSRYVQSHMLDHQAENAGHGHPIAFSFADFSYWCYACDSYVEHPLLDHAAYFFEQKFGECGDDDKAVFAKMQESKFDDKPAGGEEEEKKDVADEEPKDKGKAEGNGANELANQMAGLKLGKDQASFTYEDLVEGFKAGKYKRVLVLTGAGISVSAGIPDFRSPKTGIYANLAEYNLPTPETLFALDYFKEKPQAWYKFAKSFDLDDFNPTPAHFFLKMLQDKGILWKNMTQNIDNLEEKTGMDMEAVLQCHGADRDAECSVCRAEHSREALKEHIKQGEVFYCDKESCAGKKRPIKPAVVFFGESLPPEFFECIQRIPTEPDLCLIMGTALAVAPFNVLPGCLREGVPKVLFNLDNTKDTGGLDFEEKGRMKLLVRGKCDETLAKLAEDCGWKEDFEKLLPDCHKNKDGGL